MDALQPTHRGGKKVDYNFIPNKKLEVRSSKNLAGTVCCCPTAVTLQRTHTLFNCLKLSG